VGRGLRRVTPATSKTSSPRCTNGWKRLPIRIESGDWVESTYERAGHSSTSTAAITLVGTACAQTTSRKPVLSRTHTVAGSSACSTPGTPPRWHGALRTTAPNDAVPT
jgi:hypothetical protein